MGLHCGKQGQDNALDLREDEQKRKEYYLNIPSLQNDLGAANFDIKENKRVGYGKI